MSDLASQSAPLISMQMFDEFVAPYLGKIIRHVHNLGSYVMFHTCGYAYPLIERLIDIGVDILDPIQPVNSDMGPENLKKKFGGRICFHGGIDVQSVLPLDSPEQVCNEAKHYREVFGKNGGYICAPSHYIQPDTPVENIFASMVKC